MTTSVDAVVLRLVAECRRLTKKCREDILTPEDLYRLDDFADKVERRTVDNAKDVLRRTQNTGVHRMAHGQEKESGI